MQTPLEVSETLHLPLWAFHLSSIGDAGAFDTSPFLLQTKKALIFWSFFLSSPVLYRQRQTEREGVLEGVKGWEQNQDEEMERDIQIERKQADFLGFLCFHRERERWVLGFGVCLLRIWNFFSRERKRGSLERERERGGKNKNERSCQRKEGLIE